MQESDGLVIMVYCSLGCDIPQDGGSKVK